jgi:phytoene dehydrogenase-like protein
MDTQYDVIVVGGGTAGIVAAIQAGRAGARTLLVEKNAMLGGTMTVGGINAPAHFFVWGRQIIGGIGWELVRRTLEETGQPVPAPEYSAGTKPPRHLSMDIAVFAALCDRAVLDAGVDLLFHAMGQAAGAMAALSARTGVDPEALPLKDVYALLRQHTAIVPGE